MTNVTRVHFLDVGAREYGDAVLCELGGRTVLIDGAHPGDDVRIADQLRSLLDVDGRVEDERSWDHDARPKSVVVSAKDRKIVGGQG